MAIWKERKVCGPSERGCMRNSITDSRTGALQINVKTDGGVVQLMGFVDDEAEKRAAGEIARSVDGVTSVKNDLEVRHR